jgi:ADP-ribosylglycohydrolase
MGISPIGLINANNPNAAIQDAITFCTATHMTNVATAGACAVAAAVAKTISSNTTLEEIINAAIHGATIGVGQGHPGLGGSVARKIDLAVTWAVDESVDEHDRLQNLHDLIGVTPSAADVVPCAFGILAMVNGHPVETAVYATALSGKADTVGAIAGAIAGAWHTIETIPLEHINFLKQANPQLNIEETAEGLYEIARENYHENEPEPDEPLTSSFLDELA